MKKVGEFKQFTPLIKSELPEYFKEKAELGYDHESDEEIETLHADKQPVFNVLEN